MEIKSPQLFERDRVFRKRWLITILLLVFLSGIATFAVAVRYKNYLIKDLMLWAINRGHNVMQQDRGLVQAVMQAPFLYARSLRSAEKIQKLIIDIKFKHFTKLQKKRDEALAKGFLVTGPDDFVPASIRLNGKTVKVKLRLKGDLVDHLQDDKWSFRIKVRGEKGIFGLKRFSIQNPSTRSFQAQPLFFEILREQGVLTPRYFFVDVTVNGNDIGIMALEEHFSKEMLESQARRESVIIKFDESYFWDEWMALRTKGPVFDNYRNAAVDAFQSSKIARSEVLSKHYETAVGLLRGFVNDDLAVSEVFDTELMGRLWAVSELLGARHGISWNNQRFYFNPITARLEPIAFDSFRKLLTGEAFNVISLQEPFSVKVLNDPEVFEAYKKTINEMTKDIVSGALQRKMKSSEERYLATLGKEFFFLQEFPYNRVTAHAQKVTARLKDGKIEPYVPSKLVKENYPKYRYATILHAFTIQDLDKTYLELANAVPDEVEIRSIKWISTIGSNSKPFETIPEIRLPITLEPTPCGAFPVSQRIYFQPLTGSDYLPRVTAVIKGDAEFYTIQPKQHYAPLKRRPTPVATAREQLLQNQFLIADTDERNLRVKQGTWTVNGSLVIPPGWTLSISPATTLQFGSDAGLIAYGGLDLQGTDERPIILQPISDTWQGVVVLNAVASSRLSYVTVDKTTGIKRPGWELASGVSFYQSDVDMGNCVFMNNQTEDAVNIIRSHFSFDDVTIMNTTSDGFDSDFSDGTITGGVFQDIGKAGGGDGIDVSGSRIRVQGTTFRNVADKALSVGEQSEMKASNLVIKQVGTGAVSKDSSQLEISASTIIDPVTAGLMAYIKKPVQFGPGRIDAKNMKFIGNENQARAQKGSIIVINGVSIQAEDIDVDQLYKTIMKSARRK